MDWECGNHANCGIAIDTDNYCISSCLPNDGDTNTEFSCFDKTLYAWILRNEKQRLPQPKPKAEFKIEKEGSVGKDRAKDLEGEVQELTDV